jgi:AcrR family transcriptional regulator
MMTFANGDFGPAPTQYFADFVEGRRGEILDAGLLVFGEKGYQAGTMREIAANVGVSEPALYRHYDSKEAILSDIVATAGDRIASQMRAGLATVTGDNVVGSLHRFIEIRRRGFGAMPQPGGTAAEPRSDSGGLGPRVGGVMHVLFHAAPHNETFIGLFRAHLGKPLVQSIRELIPRVDRDFGIKRTAEELDSRVRVFMSLFAGYFTTSLLFDRSEEHTSELQSQHF